MNSAVNDVLRQGIEKIRMPNVLLMTEGIISSFSRFEIKEIMEKVKSYDNFNGKDDVWQEHDFGSFSYKDRKIYWKIDDYGGIEGHNLVLTVMLEDEY